MTQGPDGPSATNHSEDAAGIGPAASDSLAERVLETRVVHRGHYLEMRVLTIERPDGSRSMRDIVWHPGAVAIVALDPEDQVLLVRQFRVATGQSLLEIPAGTLDRDAATGELEDPDVAAARELEEETGYRAGRWERIGDFWTAPGFATERMWLYLATDLRPADTDRLGPDEDEQLQLERLPWREAVAMADRGEFRDAKSIVGLLHLARRRASDAPVAAPGPVPGTVPGADPEAVRLTYRMTTGDYVRAGMALAVGSKVSLALGLLLAAVAVPPLLDGDYLMAALYVALSVFLLTGLYTAPFILWAARGRRDLFESPIEMVADSRGVAYRSPFGASDSTWATFRSARERSGFLFLDTGANAQYIVPIRAVPPADLERLRGLVAMHVGVERPA